MDERDLIDMLTNDILDYLPCEKREELTPREAKLLAARLVKYGWRYERQL